MAKKRIPIPSDIAANVMFKSDRNCCICRNEARKTEIHHIDDDPSNNDFSNLALLCKDHHSDAHTNFAFARNLTPDLIRMYNDNWRMIVHKKLSLNGEQGLLIEYQQQVLIEIALIPHAWKNHYIILYPGQFQDSGYNSLGKGGDVWDMITEVAVHQYTYDEWMKYLFLFDDIIKHVTGRLEAILMAHGEVIPIRIKLATMRTISQLDVQRSVYLQLPQLINLFGNKSDAFATQFKETVRSLSSLSRLADKECKALELVT
jgi:hypothetical protein